MANTERFLYNLKWLPKATQFAMSDLFKDGYEIEGYNIDTEESFVKYDPQYTQLGQEEKKEC